MSASTVTPTLSRQARLVPVLVALATIAALDGCSPRWTLGGGSPRARFSEGAPERSTSHLMKKPQDAAACIIENAQARGNAADLVPLYGMESVAVTVKTSLAGEVIAVFSLMPGDGGSIASTTTWSGESKREALTGILAKGC
jgi:hypothetical protein